MKNKGVLIYMQVSGWLDDKDIEEHVREFYKNNHLDYPIGKVFILPNVKKNDRAMYWIGKFFKFRKFFLGGWGHP